MTEDGGGERDGLAAETETGLDDLFPGIDVVLVFTGEELAHLEVDAIDIGRKGEDDEQHEEGQKVGDSSCADPPGGGFFLREGFFYGAGFAVGDSVDQADGELEFGAEFGFAGGHLAGVGLVVEAGEVEQAVEEQDADLDVEGVAEGGGLAGGSVERDGKVAGMDCELSRGRGEAEDVGGFVLAAVGAVEALERGVAGEEDVDLAGKAYGGAGAGEEAREAGLRE